MKYHEKYAKIWPSHYSESNDVLNFSWEFFFGSKYLETTSFARLSAIYVLIYWLILQVLTPF